jgi:hypothetical protein
VASFLTRDALAVVEPFGGRPRGLAVPDLGGRLGVVGAGAISGDGFGDGCEDRGCRASQVAMQDGLLGSKNDHRVEVAGCGVTFVRRQIISRICRKH